jgi:hypothetical protein
MDLVVYAIILILFATFVTVHTVLCAKLAKRVFWRGLVGFLAFPLAPYWAQAQRIKRWPTLWVASASCYLVALFVGLI